MENKVQRDTFNTFVFPSCRLLDELQTGIPETKKYIKETEKQLEEVTKAEEELGGKVRGTLGYDCLCSLSCSINSRRILG